MPEHEHQPQPLANQVRECFIPIFDQWKDDLAGPEPVKLIALWVEKDDLCVVFSESMQPHLFLGVRTTIDSLDTYMGDTPEDIAFAIVIDPVATAFFPENPEDYPNGSITWFGIKTSGQLANICDLSYNQFCH